uniref:RRM domain-containing protein n=1 Tax=Panagrellus redivivus TaxID=6233 RepID=A0A7E4W1W1_PANRE
MYSHIYSSVPASMTPPMGANAGFSPFYAQAPMVNGISPLQNGEGPAQMRKLFIGGLNHETTDDQLREYYSKWGTVVDCIVIRDPVTKHSRGFGFVTYATIQMAETAMNGRPHTINGKVVDPKRAIPREQMLPMTASNPPYFLENEPQQECKIILSGIHWDFHTVDGLRQHFENFGSVEQVEILGHPRGFGFVVFEEKDAVNRCKAFGKLHSVNGKKVEVKTDTSLDLPTASAVYSKRRHNISGNYNGPTQHSNTATPDSMCSTEYTSSSSIRSEPTDTKNCLNNLQSTPTC